ncbi:MAG: pseudaminic acid synthase [Lachnospiraceae bacterium]|nr:pseudaminic acid synthase [Lachnospiraceae bacterium]
MRTVSIGDREVGGDAPAMIVAELSGNHNQDFGRAVELIHAAHEAGADAIKLQTYTADTITIDSDKPYFRLDHGTIWDGTTLYSLYQQAYTPWDWQPKLCEEAKKLGMLCFSSPFDRTAVDFMEETGMPAFKIASFEITDVPLIRYAASKHKPVILATGIAEAAEIRAAVDACRQAGNDDVILLKCVSAYPTPYEEVNLRMMPALGETYDTVSGLSDHTPGSAVAVAAAALGAKMIEKHLTLRRADGGPDSAFSMEPEEFARMIREVRIVEKALGKRDYALTDRQRTERSLSRSLFVVQDIAEGELLSPENIRSIRPGDGLPPARLDEVIGRRAAKKLERGEPLREGDFR